MNKIQKIFKTLKLVLKQPSLINLIIDSDERWNGFIQKKHPLKTQLPTIDFKDLLPNSDYSLNTFSFLGGGSLPTDIMLLAGVCKQIQDCSYFEIGTWRGESVINVSENAKECYTLNLSKEQILELGLPKKYADLHGFYSKEKENITHLFGNSLTYDFGKLNKKFDVIFIDGNHKYDFVKNDTAKVFKHLMHENSIVIWHDYAYEPEKVRPEVLAGILDGIPEEYQDNLYHVSNTLCAIYTNKKIDSSIWNFPVKPNKFFSINATLKDIKD
ncbi:class I SAM-dependent methyltransferase [Polaribacter pectinis]|uniref:Class I SAM-dependent methyltransferase n=1 Tax=Polaribacter pectinis TaxID=2738844 RepID=A0A7G9L6L7_9FLAO|nr:class I SAM-dependent methyltransferase [Polaribacter pectinis]QNM84266.1 class I SAM-dependent methyltransferase [Polaribacter pectinis]